ncbi:MAG: histidine phosphatase family protein [Candidatus Gastranaerophilales bacterium]|nr:histidine phosphatase family protein [Candidatus Gastranaerophilales bacterium]
MFKRICKIIFVRHGATIYSQQKRLYDADDYPPLNQEGREEIKNLTEWLQLRCPHIDAIYSSSALRSIQSARIISKEFGADYEILDGLYERKSGIWAGLTFDQIEEKYPHMLMEYKNNPNEFSPEGGESTSEFKKRVGLIIDKIVNDNISKTIIVVSHAGVIQSAIAHALQIPSKHQSKIVIPTGSATQINYYDDWASLGYSGCIAI